MFDAAEWATDLFGDCELGDARLTTRLVDFARRLATRAGASIVRCCDGDSAAQLGRYRFLRNDRVRDEAIAQGGFAAVARRAQDTSLLLPKAVSPRWPAVRRIRRYCWPWKC